MYVDEVCLSSYLLPTDAQGGSVAGGAAPAILPFSISVDKNAASPEAVSTSQAAKVVPQDCKLRRVKYLKNVIEQEHRFVKKKVRASQCFKSFHTAERTLEGIEAMNMIRKGQIRRLAGGEAQEQAKFVESPFGIAA